MTESRQTGIIYESPESSERLSGDFLFILFGSPVLHERETSPCHSELPLPVILSEAKNL